MYDFEVYQGKIPLLGRSTEKQLEVWEEPFFLVCWKN
jgi:hypothetical protein